MPGTKYNLGIRGNPKQKAGQKEPSLLSRVGGKMQAETYPFVMRPLPYEVYALSPCISAECVHYHHDKIYKKYVDLLNQDLSDYPNLQKKSMKELLSGIENLPAVLQEGIRIHGGGAYAHELYFDSMLPIVHEQDPKGVLQEAIIRDFGAVRDLREGIKRAAKEIVGVGYVWLVLGMDGEMKLLTTLDQDYPDLKKTIPLLVLDVWEHAYYLQYQERLEDHLNAWLRLVNWRKVARRYEEGMEEVERKTLLYSGGSVVIRMDSSQINERALVDSAETAAENEECWEEPLEAEMAGESWNEFGYQGDSY